MHDYINQNILALQSDFENICLIMNQILIVSSYRLLCLKKDKQVWAEYNRNIRAFYIIVC
jgi:hypothetical protein